MDRRTFLTTTGAGLAGLSLAAPYVARAAAPLTLRWAHFAQEDHPANIAAKQFAARVAINPPQSGACTPIGVTLS